MAEFRWIKAQLFVILMLQCPVEAKEDSRVLARAGADVTLPCDGVIAGQVHCGNTTWLSSRTPQTTPVKLIDRGNVSVHHPQPKSGRLSVTAQCSLLIRNITDNDAGRYTCRQFGFLSNQETETSVLLSVVSVTKEEEEEKTIWQCAVWFYGSCEHTLEWLRGSDVKEFGGICSSRAIVTNSHLPQGSASCQAPLTCRVTDKKTMDIVELSVGAGCERNEWWWLVLVALAVATILIIVIALIVWKIRTKGHAAGTTEPTGATTRRPETAHMTVDPEGDASYSSISFSTSNTKSNPQRNTREGDTVTYSTVRPHSAGVSTDAAMVYASVNEPK